MVGQAQKLPVTFSGLSRTLELEALVFLALLHIVYFKFCVECFLRPFDKSPGWRKLCH